jgi:hypothetical protein
MPTTQTHANKIRKVLKANAFETYNGVWGFRVKTVNNDSHQLSVIYKHFGDTNEVAPILAEMGYEVSAPNKSTTLIYLTNN